jgi:hypothetical protein
MATPQRIHPSVLQNGNPVLNKPYLAQFLKLISGKSLLSILLSNNVLYIQHIILIVNAYIKRIKRISHNGSLVRHYFKNEHPYVRSFAAVGSGCKFRGEFSRNMFLSYMIL